MKIILLALLMILILPSCGPRYTLDYQPAPGLYNAFLKDQKACEEWASYEALKCAGIHYKGVGMFYSDCFDLELLRCMKSKGHHKVKIYDLPLKKGYGEKGVKYYGR